MPDTLKQFYNATIDAPAFAGGATVPLFTNNATTRAVIKDIAVNNNTFPAAPNLTVAGTRTASLASNVSGSEIVDVSQAVGVSFTPQLSFTLTQRSHLSLVSGMTFSSIFNINGTQSSSTSVDRSVVAQDAGTSYSTVVYYAPDGDVFSVQTNGQDTYYLFKNAGSAGGTRTTINTGNETNHSPIAFDGVNTFYWLSSTSNLRIFNADTETTTNITMTANDPAAGLSRLVFSNGHLLYQATSNNLLHIIEVSTGRWFRFTGSNGAGNWDQASGMVGFWFEPSTRVATVFFYRSASPTVYIRLISPVLPAFTIPAEAISTAWGYQQVTASGFGGISPSTSNVTISLSSADGGVMHTSSNVAAIFTGLSGPSLGGVNLTALPAFGSTYWRARSSTNFSPTINTTNFPNTISLRVTGVEVTP
jgi:hypothetical protein